MAFMEKFKNFVGWEDDYYDEWEDEEYGEDYQEEPVNDRRAKRLSKHDVESDYMKTPEMAAPISQSYGSANEYLESNVSSYGGLQIAVHNPITYNDAQEIIKDVKEHKIVIVNYEMLDEDKKKQVFEFVNGGVYSLEARINAVKEGSIFVLAPKGSVITNKKRGSNDAFSFKQD